MNDIIYKFRIFRRYIIIQLVLLVTLVVGYFLIINSKIKNKGSLLLEKVIIAVFSALISALFLAYLQYTPVEEQQVNVGYFSFGGLFISFLIYSLPVFLIFGTIYSFLIDVYFENVNFRNEFSRYITEFLAYIAGGLLAGIISFNFSLVGIFILSSLLFFHISLLLKLVKKVLKPFKF